MESMIKIDNGVSKKAMDEVAEVAERLFKAAHTYDINGANLGIALNMVGKTIKSGKVNISHCNLTTTLERKSPDEEPTPGVHFAAPPAEDLEPMVAGSYTAPMRAGSYTAPMRAGLNKALRNGDSTALPGRANVQRKINILRTLATNSGFRMDVFPDEARVEINSHTPGLMEAQLTYEFIAYHADDDLHRLIPKMSEKDPDDDQEG